MFSKFEEQKCSPNLDNKNILRDMTLNLLLYCTLFLICYMENKIVLHMVWSQISLAKKLFSHIREQKCSPCYTVRFTCELYLNFQFANWRTKLFSG